MPLSSNTTKTTGKNTSLYDTKKCYCTRNACRAKETDVCDYDAHPCQHGNSWVALQGRDFQSKRKERLSVAYNANQPERIKDSAVSVDGGVCNANSHKF